MTTTTPTPSAKEQVLAWVRSKNPQTLELKFGCKLELKEPIYGIWRIIGDVPESNRKRLKIEKPEGSEVRFPERTWIKETCKILGSDMWLQELLIAIRETPKVTKYVVDDGGRLWDFNKVVFAEHCYDLTKNLHNQSEGFYTALLPLIHND